MDGNWAVDVLAGWLAGSLVGRLDGWHRLASHFLLVYSKLNKNTQTDSTVCSIIKSALHSIFDASAGFIFCTESVNIIRPVYFAASVFHIKIVVAVITNYFQNYYRCYLLLQAFFSLVLLSTSLPLYHSDSHTFTLYPFISFNLLTLCVLLFVRQIHACIRFNYMSKIELHRKLSTNKNTMRIFSGKKSTHNKYNWIGYLLSYSVLSHSFLYMPSPTGK